MGIYPPEDIDREAAAKQRGGCGRGEDAGARARRRAGEPGRRCGVRARLLRHGGGRASGARRHRLALACGRRRHELGYVDLDGDEGASWNSSEPGEDWGFEFEGVVFDGVRQCRNACTFCFMRQLPDDMRSSLTLRDDDFA